MTPPPTTYPISIAPMMEHTDRHYRAFMRLLTKRTFLYTEMVTAEAVIRGDREKLLAYDEREHPLSLQLGGNDPARLAEAAAIGASYGYDEINLNAGCPSNRVQDGGFGACLMLEPKRAAACIRAMQDAVTIPVTIKHRLGVDEFDHYEDVKTFMETVRDVGCQRFIVHARKAILGGISPKDNRSIPPLRYQEVYLLKEEFPTLTIEINGGIRTLNDAHEHLRHVDGVMLGRAAYDNPFLFAAADSQLCGADSSPPTIVEIAPDLFDYIEEWLGRGESLRMLVHPFFNLFAGQPGARKFRQRIAHAIQQHPARLDDIRTAFTEMIERR